MDAAPDSGMPEPSTQQEQLVARLQPESEPEERLVRQIAFCSVKLEHIATLLTKAEEQLQKVLEDSKDELTL